MVRSTETFASLATAAESMEEPLDPRRTSVRFPVHAEVELVEPAGATGITINVSGGGLRIALDRAVREGEHCVLRVTHADGVATLEHVRVVWCRELSDGAILGVEFVKPS